MRRVTRIERWQKWEKSKSEARVREKEVHKKEGLKKRGKWQFFFSKKDAGGKNQGLEPRMRRSRMMPTYLLQDKVQILAYQAKYEVPVQPLLSSAFAAFSVAVPHFQP